MFEELKTFITVVELKNFTKAGLKLNLSQPTVSKHIKNLEQYFKVILINRSIKQKNISITEDGHILYKRSKEILNLLDLTYMELNDHHTKVSGTIKIGASYTIGEYVLPKFLAIFLKKYPHINTEIHIDNTHNVCSSVSDFLFDIGLIEGSFYHTNLYKEYFYKDKMTLVTPYDLQIDSINSLNNFNWIVREKGSGTREYVDLFLSYNKISPKNIMVLGSNYAVKEAVKNNLGITIISKLVVEQPHLNQEVNLYELDDSFIRNFSYITSKNTSNSYITNLFIEELKNYSLEL